jgi:hypothetical protein
MTEDDPRIGEELPDGRVCAGISPRTAKPMYVNGRDGRGPRGSADLGRGQGCDEEPGSIRLAAADDGRDDGSRHSRTSG